ncbi:helix-turn-helix domain-containing protein [Geodermatophilus sp. SYSU D00815]
MADADLPALVRRRLTELDLTPEQASRQAHWAVAPQTIARLAAGRHRGPVSERLAVALARALGVPENRVRRLAGLAEVPDPRVDVETGPHLRLIRGGGGHG